MDTEDPLNESNSNAAVPAALGPEDFAEVPSQKPRGFQTVVAHAEEIMIDRFRAALEIHYEEVAHAAIPPDAEGPQVNSRLRRRAASFLRSARYEALQVPDAVKEVLREPNDESDWSKLEAVALSFRTQCSCGQTLHLPNATELQKAVSKYIQNATSLGSGG